MTLAEMVPHIKEQLGMSDNTNFRDTVTQAALQLGVDPAGKSLIELAKLCMRELVGDSEVKMAEEVRA